MIDELEIVGGLVSHWHGGENDERRGFKMFKTERLVVGFDRMDGAEAGRLSLLLDLERSCR